MSEQEEITDQPPADDAREQRVRKRRGFGIAFLALLFLISVAAAGYLYWRVEGVGASGGIASRLDDDIARLEREVARTRSMSRGDTEEMQARLAELARSLAAQGEVLDSVGAALSADDRRHRSPDPGAWRIAEVEYLLRLANNRLLMERDARAAEQMLASADAILEELDDYALHDVRGILAQERMALANTRTANAQSIFLTLEAVKDALGGLPLKQPEYFKATEATGVPGSASAGDGATDRPDRQLRQVGSTPEVASGEVPGAPAADPGSFGEALRERLYGLFEFRTRERIAPRPLIRPDEAIYLELNLRLVLERAQLAALRGNQTLFAASLKSARDWLDTYVDPDHAGMRHIVQELDSLAGLDIERPLPDISGSLARLLEIQRRGPETAPLAEQGRTE